MLGNFIKLIGTALLIDVVLLKGVVPLTMFLLPFLLPTSYISAFSAVLWTYTLFVFCIVLFLVIFLAWTLEGYYIHLFDFWDLMITMLIILAIIVYWDQIVVFVDAWKRSIF